MRHRFAFLGLPAPGLVMDRWSDHDDLSLVRTALKWIPRKEPV
jgi:hypothetical protein